MPTRFSVFFQIPSPHTTFACDAASFACWQRYACLKKAKLVLLQMAIIKCGALEPLVQLLIEAQPDGQYSAAALLNNLAADPGTSDAILGHKPLPAIAAMLKANSWCHHSVPNLCSENLDLARSD
jgi:hypothetical protein